MDSLYTAASGMLGQQIAMDAIANNLANVNTNGYKRGRTAFADLLYREIAPEEAAVQGNRMGLGTRVVGIQVEFEQGSLQTTGGPLDVAIEGSGFFQVKRADGSLGYTRSGDFTLDANGTIVTNGGDIVQPPIRVPANAKELSIAPSGAVTANVNGRTVNLGQLRVATFANPYGLTSIGDGMWAESQNSGAAAMVRPGDGGSGLLRQGILEASNVSAVDEMVNMITTQRAYEAVSKVISASDEMMGQANNLRR